MEFRPSRALRGLRRAPSALVGLVAIGAGMLLCSCGTSVGLPCESRTDCGAAQDCFLEPPGGYCSRGCTEGGSTRECPDGTLCTYFGNSQLLCATRCEADSQCRLNYACVEAGGTTAAKACRPELILR